MDGGECNARVRGVDSCSCAYPWGVFSTTSRTTWMRTSRKGLLELFMHSAAIDSLAHTARALRYRTEQTGVRLLRMRRDDG